MDYSPYYVKNYGSGAEKAGHGSAPPRPLKKRSRRYSEILLVVFILLSFALSVAASEYFTQGKMYSAVASVFTGTNKTESFYTVARGGFANQYAASSNASYARVAGGAGFIFTRDSQYFVALATFTDKKDAEAVAAKNSGTEVVVYSFLKSELNSSDLRGECLRLSVDNVAKVTKIISGLATESLGFAEAVEELTDIRNAMLSKKEELIKSSLSEDEKSKLLAVINPMFAGLESVIASSYDSDFIPALRYLSCATVDAADKYFNP